MPRHRNLAVCGGPRSVSSSIGSDYNAGVMRFLQITILSVALLSTGGLSAYSQSGIPKDLAITLERSMCFRWCPAYTLTILDFRFWILDFERLSLISELPPA